MLLTRDFGEYLCYQLPCCVYASNETDDGIMFLICSSIRLFDQKDLYNDEAGKLLPELQIRVKTMNGSCYKSYRSWEQTPPYKAVEYRKTGIGIRKIQVQNP